MPLPPKRPKWKTPSEVTYSVSWASSTTPLAGISPNAKIATTRKGHQCQPLILVFIEPCRSGNSMCWDQEKQSESPFCPANSHTQPSLCDSAQRCGWGMAFSFCTERGTYRILSRVVQACQTSPTPVFGIWRTSILRAKHGSLVATQASQAANRLLTALRLDWGNFRNSMVPKRASLASFTLSISRNA